MPNTDQPDALDMRQALTAWILERVGGVRPGIVQSYDQAQRLAVVQPTRRRKIFGTPQDLPVVRAPVGWWRFGTMVLVGEVQPGDEVLLVTCEREIWPWYVGGQVHDPTSERMHNPSDSVALPWLSSIKRAITARTPGTFYMGREDGSAGITITQGPAPGFLTVEGTTPGGVRLGNGAALGVARLTDPVAVTSSALLTLQDAFNAWVPVANDGGAALKTALATFLGIDPGVVVSGTGTIVGGSVKVLAE